MYSRAAYDTPAGAARPSLPWTRSHGPQPRPRAGTLDFARLLGPAQWASLPASLRRRFAPGHAPAEYRGTMDLDRSAVGAVFAWLVRRWGAPLLAERAIAAETVVAVWGEGDGVVWERRIGPGHRIRSVKQPGPDGTLLERTQGGLGMVLDVSVQDAALVFTSRRFFLALGRWRLPIPALLTPGRCRVEHRAIDASRFRFTLTMTHPLWGTTFRQSGVFTDMPECAS